LTYPLVDMPEEYGVDPRFRPIDAVTNGFDRPVILTRVAYERPWVAAGVEAFVAAARSAKVALEIIDVADGEHGFEHRAPTPAGAAAVHAAVAAVLQACARTVY